MSEFKSKLRQDVINPASNSRRFTTIIGTVTDINNSNKCKVNFIDKHGVMHKNEVIEIRFYGNQPWSPKIGEEVMIEQDGDYYTVISKYIKDWDKYKNNNMLKADVYSNLIIDNIPGYIT